MSDIDSSTKRLDAAVARLAAAAEKRGEAVALATADRTRLERELAALRSDFDRLRETSAGVSQRLDTAIGRLKMVLGEGS
jgi:predicted  nucleic acid-binding Zn-ribbon protein